MRLIPDGTRYSPPQDEAWREQLRRRLEVVLHSWGYDPVQTPALEVFNPQHPLAEKGFKLVDRDGTVLMLRGEYTTSVAQLVQTLPTPTFPMRLRYSGTLWVRTRDAELGRQREYTQVGAELLGVETPQSDSEILSLALECLDAVGLPQAAVEIGHPEFVRSVLAQTQLEQGKIQALRGAIHRKNAPELQRLLLEYKVTGQIKSAVLRLIDLYGGTEVLDEADSVAINNSAKAALENIKAVAELLPRGRFLFDLGIARGLDYYTGVIFQAYTPDFGQPLCGGGRYNAGLPAVGFAVGLERLTTVLGEAPSLETAFAISTSSSSAKRLRTNGKRVIGAWTNKRSELEQAARAWGVPYLIDEHSVLRLSDGCRLELEDICS
ncbi:MAG: ATP phosphoribosyltransferase regulatory subunit [Deinococcales bacterium]